MNSENLGKLVLRLSIGGMMLLHGIAKISTGVDKIGGLMESKGLPAFIAYGVYLGEVVAPILLIIGILTRLSALTVMITMVVAILTAHASDIYILTPSGSWGIELQALYLFGSLSILLLGSGKYAAKPTNSFLT